MKIGTTLMALFAGIVVLAACSTDDNKQPGTTTPSTTDVAALTAVATATSTPEATSTPPIPSGKITVFAAASLTSVFEEIKDAFESEYAGASVTYNFAGSAVLRTQLREGAPADAYASADIDNVRLAFEDGLVADDGRVFAHNRLALIVPRGDPGRITGLVDLGNSGVKLVLAQPEVPVGKYAREALQKMQAEGSFGEGFADRVLANVVSEESSVKAVVAKVQLGEADAGIVYVTDVTPELAADVTLIEIPDAFNVVAAYAMAVTSNATDPVTVAAFIEFVLSDEGQAILGAHRFLSVE